MNLSEPAHDIALRLVNSSEVYSETTQPVHVRWSAILMHWPELAGRTLLEDIGDVMDRAYTCGSLERQKTALAYVQIRCRYIHMLYISKLIPTHVKHWYDETNINYQRRLWHLLIHGRETRRSGTRIRKYREGAAFRQYH